MLASRSPSLSGVGRRPDEHLHARALAVGRRPEVRVVGAAAVLRLGAHAVVARAALAVVVDLEVPPCSSNPYWYWTSWMMLFQ
jgi:hypothetical protein